MDTTIYVSFHRRNGPQSTMIHNRCCLGVSIGDCIGATARTKPRIYMWPCFPVANLRELLTKVPRCLNANHIVLTRKHAVSCLTCACKCDVRAAVRQAQRRGGPRGFSERGRMKCQCHAGVSRECYQKTIKQPKANAHLHRGACNKNPSLQRLGHMSYGQNSLKGFVCDHRGTTIGDLRGIQKLYTMAHMGFLETGCFLNAWHYKGVRGGSV